MIPIGGIVRDLVFGVVATVGTLLLVRWGIRRRPGTERGPFDGVVHGLAHALSLVCLWMLPSTRGALRRFCGLPRYGMGGPGFSSPPLWFPALHWLLITAIAATAGIVVARVARAFLARSSGSRVCRVCGTRTDGRPCPVCGTVAEPE